MPDKATVNGPPNRLKLGSAMPYQNLTFRKKDHITVITLDLADSAFDAALLSAELTELCNEIAWDEETRVIVITGTGEGSFSVKKSYLERPPGEYEEQIISRSLSEPISKLDQPVIAAINGNASGQGLELILACDIRIAVEQSHFELPHIKTGLIPWDGGTQRLPRLIGKSKALQMVLTGERIDAREACRIGLINKIVHADELMTSAMHMAQGMASKGPIALNYAKEAIYKGMDMTMEQGLRLEADLYAMLHTTRDRAEGIQAFLEKRTPKFEDK